MVQKQLDAVDFDYEWVGGGGLNITHFYVPPAVRREGVGTIALRELIEFGQAEGAEYVVVNMRGGNAAEEFLKSNGFTIVDKDSAGFRTAELNLRGEQPDEMLCSELRQNFKKAEKESDANQPTLDEFTQSESV